MNATSRSATPFELIGGHGAIRTMVDAFYDRMDADPAYADLRAVHAPDLAPMRERLTDWLQMWMGGPADYASKHPGRGCIVSAHRPFSIGAAEAGQWLACMREAIDAAAIPEAARRLIEGPFAQMCDGLRNR